MPNRVWFAKTPAMLMVLTLQGYCQLEAKSPVFETKSSNSRTVNQQLKGFCGRSKRQRMAQVDNTPVRKCSLNFLSFAPRKIVFLTPGFGYSITPVPKFRMGQGWKTAFIFPMLAGRGGDIRRTLDLPSKV